jgi:hypothetical protein
MNIDQSKRIAMNALRAEKPVDSHDLDRLGCIGLGWAVGMGYAAYRGEGTFALTFEGLSYINANRGFLTVEETETDSEI